MRAAGSPIRSVLLLAFLLVCAGLTAHAGTLTDDLETRLSVLSASEKIPVWIKLPLSDGEKALKARLVAQDSTRAGQHRAAMQGLKQIHGGRQQPVLKYLRRLEAQGQADRIKGRWLANIVEARVSAGQLRALAARDDIELVSSVPTLELIEPVIPDQIPASPDSVQGNLSFIKANLAWKAGYTGAGRLICSFDTGVDGDHPALIGGWKGNDGDYASAWFDPAYNQTFPHAAEGSHGTHVMGILVGHDDVTGETTGVALDAEWISAAVIDIAGAPILDAFEWAADPDGDPNTVADVPDVVNHSWGVKNAACVDLFYDLIDNLEALGIVCIFAVGNEGTLTNAVRNPADRALDSLDCFAVGSVDHSVSPPLISGTSSRGPSPCNGAIKPNVCAPGASIRSSVPGTGYAYLGGTSMAAPHVSGLVALLRQKNPNATVNQIKTAILTTAPDYGYTLPNNTYGWGMIDCMAALAALPSPSVSPNVRVYAFDHAPISAGDTVSGLIALQNRGGTVNNVVGMITGADPSLTIIDGTAAFGSIPANDTGWSSDIVKVVVSDTVSSGAVLSLDFQINGTGYSTTTQLYFVVEPRTARLQVDHTANNARWTVTNYGSYGLDNGSVFPHNGLGFRTYPLTLSETYEEGLLLGLSPAQVSDGARCAAGEPDGDFRVVPDGNIALITPGAVATEETFAIFDDSRAENPMGVRVVQQTYAFTEPENDDFLIIRYILTNQNEVAITDLRVGLYFDWDVVTYASNAGGWDAADSVLWSAYNAAGTISKYRGLKLVDGTVGSAFTANAATTTYYGSSLDGWTETEKMAALSSGFGTANTYKTSAIDLMQVLSAGPLDLTAGQSDTIAFALVTGPTYADFSASADAASVAYDTRINTCCLGIRGNANGDAQDAMTITDVTYLVGFLFRGGPEPVCMDEANVTGGADGSVNLADLTYMVAALFRGGPDPLACGVTAR